MTVTPAELRARGDRELFDNSSVRTLSARNVLIG